MPRKRKQPPAPAPHHYVADINFAVEGDDARRDALRALRDSVREHSEQIAIDDAVALEVEGASILIDLSGTEAALRYHRLNHLADSMTVQINRPSYPDSLTLRWSKAR